MKYLIFFLTFYFSFSQISFGQKTKENDLITVTQNLPFNIQFDNMEELLMGKNLSHAFSLQLNRSPAPYKVYCQVIFSGVPNEALAEQIILKPSGGTAEIHLSTTPKLLLSQPANKETSVIHFDAIIQKQTMMLPTGNYNFTIQFSISQL